MTGTLRGLERDALVKDDEVFIRFLPEKNRPEDVKPAEGTVYLVCTSAGEVGVNISADDLISDLSTFESMAQCLGRVNRFGLLPDTVVHIFHPAEFDEKDEIQAPLKKTLDLLNQLEGGASPSALTRLDAKLGVDAFSPPVILAATSTKRAACVLSAASTSNLPMRPKRVAKLKPNHGIGMKDRWVEMTMVRKLPNDQFCGDPTSAGSQS